MSVGTVHRRHQRTGKGYHRATTKAETQAMLDDVWAEEDEETGVADPGLSALMGPPASVAMPEAAEVHDVATAPEPVAAATEPAPANEAPVPDPVGSSPNGAEPSASSKHDLSDSGGTSHTTAAAPGRDGVLIRLLGNIRKMFG